MLIRAGFEISVECNQETPLMALLSVHPSRAGDLRTPAIILSSGPAPLVAALDDFGNLRTRTIAPAGALRLTTDFIIEDSGLPDDYAPGANEVPVGQLPDRVQAIVDYVHRRLTFGYQFARSTRTAWDGHEERVGVCRDFAHLAIALCRCMNIPARYATGYLGDIGVPAVRAPMDFSAWFEAFLGGRWFTFDARHNTPRIGRILMARGRDAADCAITTTFGVSNLTEFKVVTNEVQSVFPAA
jgi:hypothetical protein